MLPFSRLNGENAIETLSALCYNLAKVRNFFQPCPPSLRVLRRVRYGAKTGVTSETA